MWELLALRHLPNLRRRLVGWCFFFFFKYQLEALDFPLWGKKEGRRRGQSPSFALAGSLSRAEVGELPAAFWVWGHWLSAGK